MDIIPISADDHIWEHPTTWTSRVEARFRDRCPQLRDIDGEDWWVYNDEPVRKVGTGAAALIEGRGEVQRYFDAPPGAWEPSARLAAMNDDGVAAQVLFPQAGYTKRDVLTYYLVVADGALRAAGGRPNVLVRYPNGIDRPFFYQKRAPASRPDWIDTVELAFPSGRTAEEIVPRDAAALAGCGRDRRRVVPRPRAALGSRTQAGRARRPR